MIGLQESLVSLREDADIIHVDIDPANISKLVNVDYPIVGDVKIVLNRLLEGLRDRVNQNRYSDWRDILKRYNSLHPLTYQDSNRTLKPQWVIKRVGELVGDGCSLLTLRMLVNTQMWGCTRFLPILGRSKDKWD